MKEKEIFGMHLTDYNSREAVRKALPYLKNRAMNKIFYLSSEILLEAEENPEQKKWIEEIDLTLCGEEGILLAMGAGSRERRKEVVEDDFLREFVKRLAKLGKSIYFICENEHQEEELKEYLTGQQEQIKIAGAYYYKEDKFNEDDMVNEINGLSPNVILSRLPHRVTEQLMCEEANRISASVWIGLLYEHRFMNRKKGTFASFWNRMFYKRRLKRKVNKYENEKADGQ